MNTSYWQNVPLQTVTLIFVEMDVRWSTLKKVWKSTHRKHSFMYATNIDENFREYKTTHF